MPEFREPEYDENAPVLPYCLDAILESPDRLYTANVPAKNIAEFNRNWQAFSHACREFGERDADNSQVVRVQATPYDFEGVEDAFLVYGAPYVWKEQPDDYGNP